LEKKSLICALGLSAGCTMTWVVRYDTESVESRRAPVVDALTKLLS
jgi:hypothetical protein